MLAVTTELLSPLHAAHADSGGRMVVFGGWKLPVHYGSILKEAQSVRSGAGMFDVSHMGRFHIRGADARDVLQKLGTNDLTKIAPGRCQYTLWCTESGGVIDDLIVNWLDDDHFMLVVNASRRADDWAHLHEFASTLETDDDTLSTAMIAVQGPQALDAIKSTGADLSGFRRFGVTEVEVAGTLCLLLGTGYTGESGGELVCSAESGPAVWTALRDAGVVPCGLGARDALRMEMGYPLYSHELSLTISPLEAGVGFAVALDGPEFIGQQALQSKPVTRRLSGFVASKPCVPQAGDAVTSGVVTSGGTSVVLNSPIGLALIDADAPAGPATLTTRGREIPVEFRDLPLIERGRPKAPSTSESAAR